MKRAFITGITGQDGAYLTDFLLKKDYEVHGLVRRTSCSNTDRIDHLLNTDKLNKKLFIHHGDLTDATNLCRLIKKIEPDEIYNLGAQSHVSVSFESPEYTANVDALGTLRILEVIRILGLEKKTRFYQASTSELYGKVLETPQNEKTPFYPRSPYGVAKLYAYWMTINYRESYGIFASNGILFNHESPLRGETFVTRKITRAVARIAYGLQKELFLGNLNALRDWGHARDYVIAQWQILQQNSAKDYVIATGEQHSVREFCELSFAHAGIQLRWQGSEVDEVGIIDKLNQPYEHLSIGDVVIRIDPQYFRPAEVETLLGDRSLATQDLGWKPQTTFPQLVQEMVENDLLLAKNEVYLQRVAVCSATPL